MGRAVRGRESSKGRSYGKIDVRSHRSPRKPANETRGGKALRYKCISCESSGEPERKVKEVHLILDCGGKTLKARVGWENKKVISVDDI